MPTLLGFAAFRVRAFVTRMSTAPTLAFAKQLAMRPSPIQETSRTNPRARMHALLAVATLCACSAAPREGKVAEPKIADAGTAHVDPAVPRLLDLARNENRVQEHLRTLSKTYGLRLTGSKSLARAVEWCRRELESYGLDSRIEPWGEFPVSFDRGPSYGRMVAPEAVELGFMTLAWTAGTNGPVRGRAVLEPDNEAELELLKPTLAGSWVVRREESPPGKQRTRMNEACANAPPAGFIRPGSKSGRLSMRGNHRVSPDALPDKVEVHLVYSQYQDLVARLAAGAEVELEFDVRNEFGPGPVTCHNVVADLKGRELPDEYVIVLAHLDAWDGAEGAQDNGAGVATTLEAARLITQAGLRPRRTLRFILVTGEEQGLFGSREYVEDHRDTLEKTSVVLNHDTGASYIRGIACSYAMLEDFTAVFAPVVDLDPERPFRVRESLGIENSGDSDHAPFIAAGVPAFIWDQDEDAYEHFHHTQFDVFESVVAADQEFSAAVVAIAAYGFAELDHLVARDDMKPVPQRRMGVRLEGTKVARVLKDGKAEQSGWREGDVIVSIDSVPVHDRRAISDALQAAGSKVPVVLDRAGTRVETVLDFTGDADEAERVLRASRRAAHLRNESATTRP